MRAGCIVQLTTSNPGMWSQSQKLLEESRTSLLTPRLSEMYGGAELYAVVGRDVLGYFAKLWHGTSDGNYGHHKPAVMVPANVSFVADAFLFSRPSVRSFFALGKTNSRIAGTL